MNQAIEFDFAGRKSREIKPEEAAASLRAGKACWLDLDAGDRAACVGLLRELNINGLAIERALAEDASSRLVTHLDCLHIGATAVSLLLGNLRFSRLDLIVTRELLVTIHSGPLDVIEQVRQSCEQDFKGFAKSLGFLLFDVFDRLADGYRRAIRATEREAEKFQTGIYGEVDDAIFAHVARADRDLLALRTALVSVQDILHKLSTRKTHFVSETTLPFLESIMGSLDRLSDDLASARDTLSESLSLYMSLVSHRTNRVVTRLTVVSVIFLPLTFLTGVYGMNFHNQPELHWAYGYYVFWAVALSLAGGLILFMRQRKWL